VDGGGAEDVVQQLNMHKALSLSLAPQKKKTRNMEGVGGVAQVVENFPSMPEPVVQSPILEKMTTKKPFSSLCYIFWESYFS
jgi:hypothetical protein